MYTHSFIKVQNSEECKNEKKKSLFTNSSNIIVNKLPHPLFKFVNWNLFVLYKQYVLIGFKLFIILKSIEWMFFKSPYYS